MRAIQAVTRPLAVVLFFAICAAPLLLFGHLGPWPGAHEPRLSRPAPMPHRLASDTFRQINEWLGDRIGLRLPLMWLGSRLHAGLLQRPMSRHLLYGRDGWLFWTDDETGPAVATADMRGRLRFTPDELGRIEANLLAARDALAACGRAALVVVAPNKQSIYPEYLAGTGLPRPATRLTDLLRRLSPAARALIVDPRPELMEAKAAQPTLLYRKTDTHWNALGAFHVYRAVAGALARSGSIDRPELAALDRYTIRTQPTDGGDLADHILFMPERFPDLDVALVPKQPMPEGMASEIAEGHSIYRNAAGRGRLLMIGDSFAVSIATPLARHFAEVRLYQIPVAVGEIRFDGTLIARAQPDVVLLEMAERHLDRLLREPLEMARACGG